MPKNTSQAESSGRSSAQSTATAAQDSEPRSQGPSANAPLETSDNASPSFNPGVEIRERQAAPGENPSLTTGDPQSNLASPGEVQADFNMDRDGLHIPGEWRSPAWFYRWCAFKDPLRMSRRTRQGYVFVRRAEPQEGECFPKEMFDSEGFVTAGSDLRLMRCPIGRRRTRQMMNLDIEKNRQATITNTTPAEVQEEFLRRGGLGGDLTPAEIASIRTGQRNPTGRPDVRSNLGVVKRASQVTR